MREKDKEKRSRGSALPPERRIPEPAVGWERGLSRLVLEGRCPNCGGRIAHPHVDAKGLSWSCPEGCNP